MQPHCKLQYSLHIRSDIDGHMHLAVNPHCVVRTSNYRGYAQMPRVLANQLSLLLLLSFVILLLQRQLLLRVLFMLLLLLVVVLLMMPLLVLQLLFML